MSVSTVFALAIPLPRHATLLVVAVPVLLGALSAALLVMPLSRARPLCVVTPLLGVGILVGLDLLTRDATTAGQAFFCLPVLYAASQLRAAGAALVTGCAITGEAIVTVLLLPVGEALTDLAYVATTLLLTSVLLSRAGWQHDRLVEQLTEQAAVDPLTGLATRRVLDAATRSALSGTDGHDGTALVLLDVDHFKSVNDGLGHPVGDAALHHIAEILQASSRPADVIARMGGDELAVLLPGCSYTAAVTRAQQLVDAVQSAPLRLPDGREVALSVSAGASHVPDHARDVRDLYATADAALYDAKHSGRARVGRLHRP